MGNKREIEKRRAYSDGVVEGFKRRLREEAGKSHGCTVVVNGSFARREASEQSDVDYFILHESSVDFAAVGPLLEKAVSKAIEQAGLRPPAASGAFAASESIGDFLKNVGGASDPNEKLTRRMLFMLEGAPLTEPDLFATYRKRLVGEVYAKADLGGFKLEVRHPR